VHEVTEVDCGTVEGDELRPGVVIHTTGSISVTGDGSGGRPCPDRVTGTEQVVHGVVWARLPELFIAFLLPTAVVSSTRFYS
jgi:hypothetical protein